MYSDNCRYFNSLTLLTFCYQAVMAKGIIYKKKRENEKILMIKCINFAKVQEISSQSDLMSNMFKEVSQKIKKLLRELNGIYEHYAVKYNVNANYDALLRILTPFEILVYYGITNPIGIINQLYVEQFFGQSQTLIERRPNVTRTKKSTRTNYVHIPQSTFQKGIVSKPDEWASKSRATNSNDYQNNVQNSNPEFTIAQDYSNIPDRINNGSRPVLVKNQQILVQKFIRDQVQRGIVLTMQSIADEARKIARNNKNFLASLGWVKNFLKRYPEMRELYQISRLPKNKSRFPESVHLEQKIQRFPQRQQVDREQQYEDQYYKQNINMRIQKNEQPFNKQMNRQYNSMKFDQRDEQQLSIDKQQYVDKYSAEDKDQEHEYSRYQKY